MDFILSIETATDICSVAISQDDDIIATEVLTRSKSHSEQLSTMIQSCILTAGIDRKKLCAVAISDGPGSYTGLRVGASTAKGLCFALDIPLIAIPTLQATAVDVKNRQLPILSTLDARRMECYTAIYDESLNILLDTHTIIWSEDSISSLKADYPDLIICGTGVEKALQEFDFSSFEVVINAPHANQIALLAADKYSRGEFVDSAYHVPHYYKSPNITQSKKHPLLGK
jgi:tRNA threonylcarbamoyladenosine biosynthesis protein TsaB